MPKRARQLTQVFFAALAVFSALASPSVALGPRVNGARYTPIAPLRLMNVGGELGLQYDYFNQTDSFRGSNKLSLTNQYFQEYVLGKTEGYVYHPRLLYFRAQAKLGLMQQVIQRSGYPDGEPGSETNDGTLDGYDVYAYFLREHPVNFAAFANKEKGPVMELFTDRYEMLQESRGGSAHWSNLVVPMDLSFTQNVNKEWGGESVTDSRANILEYTARNQVAGWMRSQFHYEYEQYTQHFTAQTPLIRIERQTSLHSHEADFVNSIYLSKDKRSTLSSTLRYFKQRGTQELETFSWEERLQLQHTENFRTYYMAGYQHTNLPDSYIDAYHAEVGAEHKLYKSLLTHVDAHARRTQFEGLREDLMGATASINYRKTTALGYLTAGYSRTLDRFERTGGSGTRPVVDESITLQSGVVEFLANPNVDRSSIVVTDPQNQITYVENFDYQIVVSGDRTGIELQPGGMLQDGDRVLVDYRYQYDSDFHYLSDDQLFHIRHDFQKYVNGLALYYRWHDLSAHDVPEGSDITILQYTDQVAGMRYQFWKNVVWTEEYREYNSTFTDYRQVRSQLEGTHRLTPKLRWGWNMGVVSTDYKQGIPGDGDVADYYFAGTRFSGTVLQNGYWSVEARGQKESGLTDRVLFGVLAKLGFRWRKIRVETGGRYEHYDVLGSQRDRTHVFVQVARVF